MKFGKLLFVFVLLFSSQLLLQSQDHVGEASVQVILPEVQDMNLLSTWRTGNQEFNDIWGYVDSQGKEYAIIGSRSHFYFVDISDPTDPELVDGFAGGNTTIWRDMKTYGQWAYGVCDNCSEGLSIFRLGDSPATNGVQMVSQTTSFFSRAHNIFVDEEHGRMYVLGSNTQGGGVIILDIQTNPEVPTLLGATNLPGGYIHDMFVRNHIAYANSGPSGLYVYDMSNPNNIQTLGTLTSYPQQGYNHASWLSDDGEVLIMADEMHNRSVKAVDVSDLTDIEVTSLFRSELLAPAATGSIAHNPFVRDNYAVISYYHDGVQVFDISNPSNVQQVAWYDTFTGNTNYSGFDGCWGVYPFLPSGNILGSDGAGGLFVLEPTSITFDPIPPVQPPFGFVNETVADCLPQGTAIFLSLTTDADVIQWYRNGNLIDVTNGITITSEGTYQAIVYKGPHSLALDPIEIVYGDAPNVNVLPSASIALCGNETEVLMVEDGADNYEWFLNGASITTGTNTLLVDEPGSYFVVADNNGCASTSEEIIVTQGEQPVAVLNIIEEQNICEGQSVILESVNEGDAYKWLVVEGSSMTAIDGATEASFSVSASGEYAVEIFLGDCSSVSEQVAINVIPQHTVSLNATTDLNFCEGESFLLTPTVESLSEPVTSYDWIKDGNIIQSGLEPDLMVDEAGDYTLLVTAGVCEVASPAVSVAVLESPSSEIASDRGNFICEGELANLTASTGGDSYQWSYNGVILNNATEPTLVANLDGLYSLTVNLGECSSTDEFALEIIEAPMLSTSLSENINICEGESVTLMVDGVAESFEWFKDGSSINIFDTEVTVSEEATYTLMAANGNCAATPISFDVEITDLPSVEILPVENNVLCPGGEIVLSVNTDAEEFAWADATGSVIATNQSTLIVDENNFIGGSIVVVASNGDCDIISEAVFIELGETPNINLQGPTNTNLCMGDAFTFSVDASYASYQWFVNGNPTNDTGSQLQANATGEYSVRVTSVDGCETISEVVSLTFNTLPNAQLAVGQNQSLCAGEAFTLEAPEFADTYSWTLNGQEIANTESIDASAAGVYQLALTTNGCTSFSQEITVNITEELVVEFDFASEIEICEGEIFAPTLAQTFDTYQWFLDGVLISTVRNVGLTVSGNYTLEVSSNSCTGTSDPFSLTVYELPFVELSIAGGVPLCEGESITVTAEPIPGADLQWFLDSTSIVDATNPSITITEQGNYNLQVTNNGCSVVSSVIDVFFTPNPIAEIEGAADRPLCEGEGLLLVSAEEADAYLWLFNGVEIANQDMPLLEVGEAGEYSLMTFLGDCSTVSESVFVNTVALPNVENISDDRILCAGETFDVTVPMGVNSFVWFIDGQAVDDIGETFTISEPGVYQLSVEIDGCTASSNTFEVSIAELPEINIGDIESCGAEEILAEAPPGFDSYIWIRDGEVLPQTGATFLITEAGDYQLGVQQGACQSLSNVFTVSIIDLPSLENVPASLQFCSGESITIDAPAGGDSYTWSRDGVVLQESDPQLLVTESGTYQLEIGVESCFVLTEIEVSVTETPIAGIVPIDETVFYCEGTTVAFNSIDTDADSLFWFLDGTLIASNVMNIEASESGVYSLIAKTGDCSAESDVETLTFQALPVIELPATEFSYCPGGFVELFVNVEGDEDFDFTWTFNENEVALGQNYFVSDEGIYQVQVVNSLTGCTITSEEILVSEYEVETPVITVNENMLTASEAVSYQWLFNGVAIPDAVEMILLAETSGDYQVAITDANGCESISEIVSVQISSVSGIPSLEAFDIYPNPVQDLMTISMTTTNTVALDVNIHNQLGQTLWTKSLTPFGTQQLDIPVDYLVPGLYYITLRSEDGGTNTIRFVKQ